METTGSFPTGGARVSESGLSRRNLFTSGAGAGAAFAAALAEAAADPLFAGVRPDLPLTSWAAAGGPAAPGGSSGLPAPDATVYLVNRLTFGQQPADLARAAQLGWDGFIEE